MEKKIQELEIGLLAATIRLKTQNGEPNTTSLLVLSKYLFYHMILPPDLQNSQFQRLFQSDPFALASEPPKSLKPGKLPSYNRNGTENL